MGENKQIYIQALAAQRGLGCLSAIRNFYFRIVEKPALLNCPLERLLYFK
jgi:hypothetical protein